MPKPTTREQQAVLSRLLATTAAALVGMKRRTFIDSDAPRNDDGTYDARKLVEWVRAKVTPVDGDPLLAGGDSPNLERYRAAKADLAEMDAAERRGHLVDVDEFVEWYTAEIAAPIRRAIETLEKQHGADVAAIVTKALAKAETAIDKRQTA